MRGARATAEGSTSTSSAPRHILFLQISTCKSEMFALCTRSRSNTPLQALNLLNDPVFFEMAKGMAFRILTETPGQPFEKRVDRAFDLCFARKPELSELELLRDYFIRQRALLEDDDETVHEWFPFELAEPGEPSDRTALAAWVGISRILLNMDEFITRE